MQVSLFQKVAEICLLNQCSINKMSVKRLITLSNCWTNQLYEDKVKLQVNLQIRPDFIKSNQLKGAEFLKKLMFDHALRKIKLSNFKVNTVFSRSYLWKASLKIALFSFSMVWLVWLSIFSMLNCLHFKSFSPLLVSITIKVKSARAF